MKRIIFLLLFLLTFTAASAADELHVMTTVFPSYDFTRIIGGDAVRAELLLPPGTDNHSYEPTPKDILRISDCDLLIITGGEGDLWVEQVLEALGKDAPRIAALTDMTDTLTEELKEGMQGEAEDAAVDEHVWTSPVNVMQITDALCGLFSEMRPESADAFRANADAFILELEQLDSEYRAIVENASRKLLLFGDRFPFRYFTETYRLEYYAAFPGCSAEVEPSASTVAFLIDRALEEKVPVILYTETSNHQLADMIAGSVGGEAMLFHSCHNVSAEMLEEGVSYIGLMRANEPILEQALTDTSSAR